MIRRTAVREAHKAAARRLREGPSYATPCPMAQDVLTELRRAGVDVGREDVIESCREAGLPLSDMPAESADEITRKLKSQ